MVTLPAPPLRMKQIILKTSNFGAWKPNLVDAFSMSGWIGSGLKCQYTIFRNRLQPIGPNVSKWVIIPMYPISKWNNPLILTIDPDFRPGSNPFVELTNHREFVARHHRGQHIDEGTHLGEFPAIFDETKHQKNPSFRRFRAKRSAFFSVVEIGPESKSNPGKQYLDL